MPHMLVRNCLEFSIVHLDPSNSPGCYLYCRHRHRYPWVALQHRSYPVFWPLVSNLIA